MHEDLLYIQAEDAALGLMRLNNGMFRDQDAHAIDVLCEEIALAAQSRIDPITAGIYGPLVWPNREEMKGKKTGDLAVQLQLFHMNLRGYEHASPDERDELSLMCMQLSHAHKAHLDAAYGLPIPGSNSYRRLVA